MNEVAVKQSWTPTSFSEAQEFSKMVANSAFAPKDYRGKPEDCLMAMMTGNEVGLGAMASLQNIAVINGRPSIWGDAALALVKKSDDFEWIKEWLDGDTAYCQIKRKGEDAVTRSFSWDDAKRAGLTEKSGPWKTYPKRMLQMRARSWAVRDVFPHVLKGFSIAEEASDVPKEPRDVTPDEPKQQPEQPAPDTSQEQVQKIHKEIKKKLEDAVLDEVISSEHRDTVVSKLSNYRELNVLKVYRDKLYDALEQARKEAGKPEESSSENPNNSEATEETAEENSHEVDNQELF